MNFDLIEKKSILREIDFLLQKSQYSHVTGAQLDVIFSIMMTIEIGSENQKNADLLKFIKKK